ncbi:ankyrin repeat domain-containing protein [Luteimonas saliphila]|uniref:ankyrin repeat domain-containing protein n=1 Tax=Luteimonas saliphila TaxID=2804919 RepID=UPI003CCD3409
MAWLLLLSACDSGLSASDRRSRHQGVLERAFSDPRAQALAIAAEHGDAAEVRRLMRGEGVDPDAIFGSSDGGMPLLVWPIYSKSPEGLRAMLENGADPNAKKRSPSDRGEHYHADAMVWAAERDDPVYLQLLLDHGGDADTRNANNEALLFHAFIKQNQWRNVQLLVERGADANANVSAGRRY